MVAKVLEITLQIEETVMFLVRGNIGLPVYPRSSMYGSNIGFDLIKIDDKAES